jgi:hypothetical protein
MALVPEMEETGEEVDDDPTPELEAARGEARDARAPVERGVRRAGHLSAIHGYSYATSHM